MTAPDGDLMAGDAAVTTTSEEELRQAIASERMALAATLRQLQTSEWDVESLCSGWRVRELVAHLTMPFRQSTLTTILGVLRARGDFNAMADRVARRDAATLSPKALIACVDNNIDNPWKPPGGGSRGALTHDVVHGLDVAVPLGRERTIPPLALGVAMQEVTSPRALKHFGAKLDGVSLRASDSSFTFGSGQVVTGATQDLLLVLCGRKLPKGRVDGAQAARFEKG